MNTVKSGHCEWPIFGIFSDFVSNLDVLRTAPRHEKTAADHTSCSSSNPSLSR